MLHQTFAILLAGALLLSGCATSVAGKRADEVFSDPNVAALVESVTRGDFARADKALKAGADVNAMSDDELTPLLWVMGTTRDAGKIEYLLKAGADPNLQGDARNTPPMYLVAGGDRPDLLELLLKYKGDPNLTGPRGETMLHVAIWQFRDRNLELLLKYGADPTRADIHNCTAACDAAGAGRFDLVARMLERHQFTNIQDLAKDVDMIAVPEHSEQKRWKAEVIEMLKARGATFPAYIPHKVPEG